MKRSIGKVIALALVLALAIPFAVSAAVGDPVPTPPWTNCIYSGDIVTVDAGATVYFEIGTNGASGTYDFVVEGNGAFDVAICTEGTTDAYAEGTPVSAVDGRVETTLTSYDSTYGYGAFSITNNSGASAEYTCSLVFPEGTEGNPKAVTLSIGSSADVTVPANGQYYIAATLPQPGVEYNLVITGNTGFGYLSGWGMPTWDNAGTFETTIQSFMGPATFAIVNNTMSEQTYSLSLASMPLGAYSNPDELPFGEVVTKDLVNQEYYYTWTATENGIFQLEMNNDLCADGWTYKVEHDYDIYHFSTGWDESDRNVCKFEVVAGDIVIVGVSVPTYYDAIDYYDPYTPASGTVVFSTGYGVADEEADKSINLTYANAYDWAATSVYVFASTEGQTVVDIHGSPDFPYFAHALLQYNEATEKFEVVNADATYSGAYVDWTINENQLFIMAHDACADADSLAVIKELAVGDAFYLVGDYNEILSGAGALSGTYFTTDDTVDHWTPGEQGGGDIGGGDANYEEMGIALDVGEGTYSASMMYAFSIYTFDPTETGIYTISSNDSLLGIVSYNGMWITIDPSEETVSENSIVWECTSVGQSIWVAAMPETNVATITITKEDSSINIIPTTDYENTVTPEDFTFNGNVDELLYVDTEDDVVDTAVLGEDGFYHLNSADGPILYVDLNDDLMNLIDAMGYGQLKFVVTEDGEAVEVIDYNTAFGEYAACADENGLYPLTADLMVIYQNVGEYQGWYGENGWVGGLEEDAWMFACYYVEGETTDKPDTGDNTNALVWVLVMLGAVALAAPVVVKKVR